MPRIHPFLVSCLLWLGILTAWAQPTKPQILVAGTLPLAPGTTVTLTAPDGFTYSWTHNNAAEIGSQRSLTTSTAGFYRVRVSDASGSAVSDPVRVTATASVGSADKNYVQEDYILSPGITTEAGIDAATTAKIKTVVYADGLGRPIQTVAVKASATGYDVVQPVEYDGAGQVVRQHLPYSTSLTPAGSAAGSFRTGYEQEQRTFYDNAPKVARAGAGPTFSEAVYEDVPGGGVIEQGAPGVAWQIARDGAGQSTFQGHTGRRVVRANTANEIPVWTYTPGTDGGIGTASYAWSPAQTLNVLQSSDEDNKTSWIYTNYQGHNVGKRIALENGSYSYTGCVFDALGRPLLELTAEGVKRIIVDGQQPTAAFLEKWGYFYQYDTHGRVIGQKMPGRGWAYRVYDSWDRLVATQNALQRKTSTWIYLKYDELNRPIIIGSITDSRDRQQLSEAIAAAITAGTYGRHEIKAITNTTTLRLGYSRDKSFPINAPSNFINSVTYYDSYEFLDQDGRLARLKYQPESAAVITTPSTASRQITGLSTIQQTRILDATTWLTTATYYDDDSRIIQTQQENQIGGVDRQTTEYDYAGKVLKTQTTHTVPNSLAHTIRYRFTYRDNGDLNETFAWLDAGPDVQEILLSQVERNELGQLVDQKLGCFDKAGGKFLQSVDYRYTIRGWQEKINNRGIGGPYYDPQSQSVKGEPLWFGPHTPNEDTDALEDLFGQELTYDEDGPLGAGVHYNGNITAATWNSRSPNLGKLRAYQYTYDAQNQLLGARFGSYGLSTTTWQWGWQEEKDDREGKGRFTTDGLTYDLNGNIRSLHRVGHKTGPSTSPEYDLIDKLTYEYDGNRLLSVEDGAGPSTAPNDFEERAHTATEYEYDENGNLKADHNKGLTIAYNLLDLPSEIRFANGDVHRYTYAANGEKLTQQIQTAAGTRTVQHVVGFVYGQGPNLFVQTPTGRALYEPARATADKWVQEYHLRDHLGSLRLAFRGGGMTLQRATMEESNREEEERTFTHVAETRQLDPLHARTGSYAARLHAGQSQRLDGPGTTLAVHAGDSVRVEVYGRYDTEKRGFAWPALLPAVVANGTPGGASTPRENGQLRKRSLLPRLAAGLTLAWAVVPHLFQPRQELPRASVQYDFYDQDSALVRSEVKYLDPSAANEWQQLVLGFKAEKDGYVQMSLRNTTEQNVWFDDAQVQTAEDLIVQENHYDPFGQNLVNLELVGTPDYAFQYTGKERIQDSGLELVDYGARYYDPQLGRWHSPDPAGQYASPYVAVGNNPVTTVDPDGRLGHVAIGALVGGAINVATHWKQIAASGNPLKDGLVAFGIGAVGGGLAAATGNVFIGKAAMATLAGGAAAGFLGSAVSSPVQGLANQAYFGDDYSLKQWGNDVTTGAIVGGAIGGGIQLFKGIKEAFRVPAPNLKVIEAVDDLPPPPGSEPLPLMPVPEISNVAVTGSRIADGSKYSVAYQMKLAKFLYPGKAKELHFKAANEALWDAMQSDAKFADQMKSLGIEVKKGARGAFSDKPPTGWAWHHDVDEGIMQLVPKSQHPSNMKSIFWETLHPRNGKYNRGGMSIWGGGYNK